jgi:hypothetical protein
MVHISGCNLLDKARRAYRRARAKDPALPPLIDGSGKVVAMCHKLYAVLFAISGAPIVYSAVPSTAWRFSRVTPVERMRLRLIGNEAPMATPDVRFKRVVDAVLVEVADIERRAHGADQSPNTIAAE